MKAALALVVGLLFLTLSCGGSSGSKSFRADGSAPDMGAGTSPGQPDVTTTQSKLIVTSSIALDVENLRSGYADIGRLARSLGGFVAQGSITDDKRTQSASLRLRVPASRHDELLGNLRDIRGAKVRSEDTGSKEITEEYTDLQSRLRNLQRNETQYQELLRQANTINDVLAVNGRLETVRGEIERTQGRINLLDNLSDFATVNVQLTIPPPGSGAKLASPVHVLVEAVETSFLVVRVILNVSIVVLVIAAWLVPTGLAALVGWRLFGKRLRALGVRIGSW